MKNLLLNNPIGELWKDAESILDYVAAFWITGLATLFVTSWTSLVIHLIMNPKAFNNVTFGIFDYI